MEVPFALVALPLGLMFFISGFILNVLQLLAVVFVLPVSRAAYRVANMVMMESLWSQLIWLLDWWAAVQVRVFMEKEDFELLGKEHALVISNHRSDVDWLVGWVIAQRVGCLGGTRAVMKKSTQFLPVIGWSMWFSEYVFLARNWTVDEQTLKSGYEKMRGFPRTLWVALFVEGTRFTKAKLLAAQQFAAQAGMRVPQNVLVPRTKGFVSAVQNLREFVPAVYDMTVAISNVAPAPTMLRMFQGKPSVVHVHIRRVQMSQLPQEDEGITKWCHDAFEIKDKMLDDHEKHNTFGEELYQPLARPLLPLLIVIFWASFVSSAGWWLLKPVLATRSGIAWVVGVLLVVMIFNQVLVVSTQSERSSAPAARKAKPARAASDSITQKRD